MIGMEQLNGDRSEVAQVDGNRQGMMVEPGKFGSGPFTLDRFTTGRREDDQSATVQLEEHRSGGHILEPSVVGAPIPDFSEFLGEPLAMPVRMGGDQLLKFKEILFGEDAALNTERFWHKPEGSKADASESSWKFLTASENR